MSTLATLEARTYARLGLDAANPGAIVVARIRGFLNETYHEILGKKGFEVLRRQLVTFYSVIGTPFGVLPIAVTRVHTIADRTKGWLLEDVSVLDIRRRDPGLLAGNSFPDSYAIYNLSAGAFRLPTAPGAVLYAVSSSASDGATKTLFIQGMDINGYPRSTSVALNGLTEVTIDSTIVWAAIRKMYIEAPATQGLSANVNAVGTISVYEYSGGAVQVGLITPGRHKANYSLIHFYPTPATVTAYTADVTLLAEDLVEEGDEPILPDDFQWLLTSGAVMKEYSRREKPVQLSQEKARYTEGLADLTVWVNHLPASPHAMEPARRSQLGSYFRPGT